MANITSLIYNIYLYKFIYIHTYTYTCIYIYAYKSMGFPGISSGKESAC